MDNKQEWHLTAIKLAEMQVSDREIARIVGRGKTVVNDYLRSYREMRAQARVDDMYCETGRVGYEDGKDNSRILVISDMHIPFQHPKLIPFLEGLKLRYQPTRVICLGDELDKCALSYHESDPDLHSAGDELRMSLPIISELEGMFPEMDIIESNHGSLHLRKAKTVGLPRHYIKSYNDIYGVGEGWKWHPELTITLPDGQRVYFHHGKTSQAIKTSQIMGMSHICGHYHESFGVQYWSRPGESLWAMNAGCLINDRAMAFSYNKNNPKRPVIGTGLIIDGVPILELMPQ